VLSVILNDDDSSMRVLRAILGNLRDVAPLDEMSPFVLSGSNWSVYGYFENLEVQIMASILGVE
jgi:hypothetical protein